jgi:hypothetical protein
VLKHLDGCFVVDQSYDPVPTVRRRLLTDQDKIAVLDTGTIHRVAPGVQKEIPVRRSSQIIGNGYLRLDVLLREKGLPAWCGTDQWNPDGPRVVPGFRNVLQELEPTVLPSLDVPALHQACEDVRGSIRGAIAEEGLELAHGRRFFSMHDPISDVAKRLKFFVCKRLLEHDDPLCTVSYNGVQLAVKTLLLSCLGHDPPLLDTAARQTIGFDSVWVGEKARTLSAYPGLAPMLESG